MSPHNCVATFLEYLRRSAVEQVLKILSAVLVNFKVPTDHTFARFGVVLVLLVNIQIFVDIMPCRLMSPYGRFGVCASYVFTSRLCTCKTPPERGRLATKLWSFADSLFIVSERRERREWQLVPWPLFGGFGVEIRVFWLAFSENSDGFLRVIRHVNLKICYKGLVLDLSNLLYEGWNFNSGNYLFTTDTK